MKRNVPAILCFACFVCLAGLVSGTAQAESVHLSEGWFATISNYTGCYYFPDPDPWTHEMNWTYATFDGFAVYPQYLRSTTGILAPSYMPQDPWSQTTNGVVIGMHDGWVDTDSDHVSIWPVMCVGDEQWYHVSFDWSTYWTASPAADDLTLELWAGCGTQYRVAWHVSPGAGSHAGHVDMDVPLTFMNPPEFVLCFNSVPEPSSVLALLSGLGGLALVRRRLKASRR